MTKPLVVFRPEASRAIGGGHVMRCLAVAEAVRPLGLDVAFAADDEVFATAPALAAADVRRLPPVPTSGAAVAVLDGYGLGPADEDAWAAAGARVAFFDDGLRRHRADLWVDPTPGRTTGDYEGLRGPATTVLSGPTHAPMKPEFASLRPAALARREGSEVRRILVGFGLTDPDGASVKALNALASLPETVAFDVIVGSAAESLPRLREAAARDARVRLHVDAPDVPRLMLEADLAVGAAGVSTWERCALGLPSVVALVAENQRSNLEALAAAGAATVVADMDELEEAEILCSVQTLLRDADARRRMSTAAAQLCDGEGAGRIARALLDLL